jgi:hypothetical protein
MQALCHHLRSHRRHRDGRSCAKSARRRHHARQLWRRRSVKFLTGGGNKLTDRVPASALQQRHRLHDHRVVERRRVFGRLALHADAVGRAGQRAGEPRAQSRPRGHHLRAMADDDELDCRAASPRPARARTRRPGARSCRHPSRRHRASVGERRDGRAARLTRRRPKAKARARPGGSAAPTLTRLRPGVDALALNRHRRVSRDHFERDTVPELQSRRRVPTQRVAVPFSETVSYFGPSVLAATHIAR